MEHDGFSGTFQAETCRFKGGTPELCGRAEKRQLRMSECMKASDSADIESSSSKHFTYALSENEKVLSAVARWGLYASMKVSQAAFEDPLFVAMLQAARGPHETKGVVPKLTSKMFKASKMFKGFMVPFPE